MASIELEAPQGANGALAMTRAFGTSEPAMGGEERKRGVEN